VLGYVAWQPWGTTFVARRDQERVASEVESLWGSSTSAPPDSEQVREVVAIARIPAFGDDVLARGFGWFDGSAGPGEVGNFAVAGHRVTHGAAAGDARPGTRRPGDRLVAFGHLVSAD
jgi:sortase A